MNFVLLLLMGGFLLGVPVLSVLAGLVAVKSVFCRQYFSDAGSSDARSRGPGRTTRTMPGCVQYRHGDSKAARAAVRFRFGGGFGAAAGIAAVSPRRLKPLKTAQSAVGLSPDCHQAGRRPLTLWACAVSRDVTSGD